MEYEKTDSKIQEKYKWVNDAIPGYFTFSFLKSFLGDHIFNSDTAPNDPRVIHIWLKEAGFQFR